MKNYNIYLKEISIKEIERTLHYKIQMTIKDIILWIISFF